MLIALIKLLLRLRSQVRIGVGAAGKTKPTSNKGRGNAPRKENPNLHQAYELTTTYTTFARHT